MSHAMQFLAACAAYVILAGICFRFVTRRIYLKHGRLPPAGTLFQLLLVCGIPVIGLMALRDARIGIGQVAAVPLVAGLALCAISALVMGLAVATFRSFGMVVGLDASGLRTGGIYSLSRNPQAVGFCFFLAGFTFLWPTWHMAPIILMFLSILHFMVVTEEAHLRNVFGEAFEAYCERTPRYLWR